METDPMAVTNIINTWRPKKISEFIGEKNRRSIERLQKCAINYRRPLKLLLIGPYGTAKTTLARHVIKTYRCRHRTADGNPCHKCADCICQSPLNNGDGAKIEQYEFDCQRIVSKKKLLPLIRDIELARSPAVFFDQLEGLNEVALRALLTFVHDFKGIIIAAIATDDFQEMKKCSQMEMAPLFERFRKVYLTIPEVEEMVAFYQSKLPEWGVSADENILRLMVMASENSFRTCLDILQAARENSPPVLDRETIKESLPLDEDDGMLNENIVADDDSEY